MMKKAKVLIVDDEPGLAETLAERLQLRDYQTLTAETGTQGMHIIRTDTPDVVLLDVSLPDINGLEVLEQVNKEFPSVQVILLTGHAAECMCIKKNLKVFDCVSKPVPLVELIKKIDSAHQKQHPEA